MTDLNEAFSAVSHIVNEGELDQEDLGDLQLGDLVRELHGVVSSELMHLRDLSEDDPEKNQDVLRNVAVQSSLKAFLAGLLVGREQGGDQDGIVVTVDPAALQEIGVAAIRDGVLTIHLVTPPEGDQQ